MLNKIVNYFYPARQIKQDLLALEKAGLVERVGNKWRYAEITHEDLQAVDDMLVKWEKEV